MEHHLGERVYERRMTRRDFMWLLSVSTVGAVGGCAVNPVSGERQLILVSEAQEIQIDKEQSPHQFSNDYGKTQDAALNNYVQQVGKRLANMSHRPNMPYNFHAVNATYVNAYAFPGGSIAATRGILLELDNEAELAGLMGHEIAHVNARHSAQRMSSGMLANAAVVGVGTAVQMTDYKNYSALVQGLGGIATGALLAHYSRDNEREADSLGMQYMTKSGLNPQGMVGLMEVLVDKSKHKPSALEMMFSTHPMSQERYDTAKRALNQFPNAKNMPQNRERYMDNTANLRRIKGAISSMQDGEQAMGKEDFLNAEGAFSKALRIAPNDYAGLVLMSRCQMALERPDKAKGYAEKAKRIYPTEAQAHHISGISQLAMNRPERAYQSFAHYERLLPGNPNTIFFKGLSLENMQNKQGAAREYSRYLQAVRQGGQAKHAHQRLQAWGFAR